LQDHAEHNRKMQELVHRYCTTLFPTRSATNLACKKFHARNGDQFPASDCFKSNSTTESAAGTVRPPFISLSQLARPLSKPKRQRPSRRLQTPWYEKAQYQRARCVKRLKPCQITALYDAVRFVGYVGGSGCGPPSAASEGCSRFLFNRDAVPTGKRGIIRSGLICTLGVIGLILTIGPLPASAPVEAARTTANAVKVVRIGFIVLPRVWGRREDFRKPSW